jgi:YD repeat-containing protein
MMAAKRLPRRNVRERRWVSLGIIGLALLVARPSEANTTVRYAFDDANRMVRVDVGTARAARYSYDASGRVIRTERDLDASNGVAQTLTTHHRYDVGDRLVAIAHVLASGERRLVVAGQAIHRLAGGLIYRLETFRSGTYDVDHGTFSAAPDVVRAYKYDGVARLTRETTTRAGETQHDVTCPHPAIPA